MHDHIGAIETDHGDEIDVMTVGPSQRYPIGHLVITHWQPAKNGKRMAARPIRFDPAHAERITALIIDGAQRLRHGQRIDEIARAIAAEARQTGRHPADIGEERNPLGWAQSPPLGEQDLTRAIMLASAYESNPPDKEGGAY